MKPLKIAGIGYCVPETVITNDDLTKLYETSDEWIFSRTGIKERRVVSGNETAIDLGYDAAKKALDKSGFKPEDIDCIISAASAPPQLYPTLSCTLQAKLGIPNQVPAFDLTAACTGLIYALQVARGFIGAGIYKTILIVAADNNSKITNWEDRGTSILFGDGAGAMVVTESDDGIDDRDILTALASFQGVGRRFEQYGEFKLSETDQLTVKLVDDYGHHPSEVKATIKAVRNGWGDRRLVMIFQPHRYTRTRDLYDDFVEVLSRVDALILLDVYAAGEDPIPGADGRSLCRSIRQRGKIDPIFVAKPDEVPSVLASVIKPGDIVLTQGAGNINMIAKKLSGMKLNYESMKNYTGQ